MRDDFVRGEMIQKSSLKKKSSPELILSSWRFAG